MKLIVSILVFLSSVYCFAEEEYLLRPVGTFWLANPGGYLEDTSFDEFDAIKMSETGEISLGVVENQFGLTRSYAFKMGNSTLSTCYSNFFSTGSCCDSLKTFTIEDENQEIIGSIEGSYFAPRHPEFCFYDKERTLFARAVLETESFSFIGCTSSVLTVSSPDGEPLFICTKTLYRNPQGYFVYHWTVKKASLEPFDGRFFWPFLSFISEVWWR